MKFKMKIQCDNAAFGDDPALEVSRILRETAELLDGGHTARNVRDINGNTVGKWELEERFRE